VAETGYLEQEITIGILPNMTSAATNRLIEPSLTYCKNHATKK